MNHSRAAHRLLSACLPRLQSLECKVACQTERRGGGSAGCCPTDCLIPVMVLKCRVQELDTGSGCQVPLPGTALVLTGVRALEWGQGPSRKQPDLDSSHSIPTSSPNTALKAQSSLPGWPSEQQLSQDSSETLSTLFLGLSCQSHPKPEQRPSHRCTADRALPSLNQQQSAVKDMKEQACGEILLSK